MENEIEKIIQEIADWSEDDIRKLYAEIGEYLQTIDEDAQRSS